MKPTESQKKLAELIKNQAIFWEGTNDINSPTHTCDLENDIDELEFINGAEKSELEKLLLNLLNFIRHH